MQFSTTLLVLATTAISFVAAAPSSLEKRADDRLIYTFPNANQAAACDSWRCNCINYKPKDTSLEFLGE